MKKTILLIISISVFLIDRGYSSNTANCIGKQATPSVAFIKIEPKNNNIIAIFNSTINRKPSIGFLGDIIIFLIYLVKYIVVMGIKVIIWFSRTLHFFSNLILPIMLIGFFIMLITRYIESK